MVYKIFINAGRCNSDPGAQYHGMRECDVNLSATNAVVEELIKRGYEVVSMQDDDIKKIVIAANQFQANLFVSLQCNAYCEPDANGTEVYVSKETSSAYKSAKAICDNICEYIGTANKGIKIADLPVLRDTAMPAMLVKMFYLSNEKDIQRMIDNFHFLVKAICDGIEEHFK